MHREAGSSSGSRRQPAVVRPAPARGDQCVGALGQGGTDEELEVPQLVSAECQREQVLALDPDIRSAAESGRESSERRQRRQSVEQLEARHCGDPGRDDQRSLIDRS